MVRSLGIAALLLLLLPAAACKKDPAADGEECFETSDCKSDLCIVSGAGEAAKPEEQECT